MLYNLHLISQQKENKFLDLYLAERHPSIYVAVVANLALMLLQQTVNFVKLGYVMIVAECALCVKKAFVMCAQLSSKYFYAFHALTNRMKDIFTYWYSQVPNNRIPRFLIFEKFSNPPFLFQPPFY